MEPEQIAAALLALGTGVGVAGYLRRERRGREARRAAYLSDCARLFQETVLATAPTGFARLSGRHDGDLWDIQVVPDTLTLRKLPALWVLVSLPQALPITGTVDLMLRPTGVETFSNFGQLPVQIAVPPGFPPDCAIRTDAPGWVPGAGALREVLGAVDGDRLKEVLITPKGVRLVFLAEEADRGRYLIFRDSEMGRQALSPARVLPFMAAAQRVRDVVLAESRERQSA